MSPPTTYQASIRVLTTALIAASIANAAVVPHQVLDARAPAVQAEQLPTSSDIAAALDFVENEAPGNIFDDLEEGLRSRTGLQFMKEFFGRLFGWDREDSPSDTITVTVSVTPTPAATTEEIGVPTELPATTTADVVVVPEITAVPTEEPMMSILPVGDLSTAINMTLPDPEFTNFPIPEETPVEPTPTAIVITDSFTAVLPIETVVSDIEGTITISQDVTSIILVTSTLIGTGASVGTGLPIINTAAPIWANTTYGSPAPVETEIPAIITELPEPTLEVPVVVINGTGAPIAPVNATLSIVLPPFANSTEIPVVIPIGTAIPTFTELPVESVVVGIPAASTSTLTTTTTLDIEDLPTIVPVPVTNVTVPVVVPTPDTIDTLLEFPGQY